MENINKFIIHFIDHKLPFAMWHLNGYGNLQLHQINFNLKSGTWKWHTGNNIKHTHQEEIKTKLPQYLLNYDMPWDKFLTYFGPIVLTYGYLSEDGERISLPVSYKKPFRTTAFVTPMEKDVKNNITKRLHDNYVRDVKLYNLIRKNIYEEIKRVNPDRANKIKLKLDDDPEKTTYLVDIYDVSF